MSSKRGRRKTKPQRYEFDDDVEVEVDMSTRVVNLEDKIDRLTDVLSSITDTVKKLVDKKVEVNDVKVSNVEPIDKPVKVVENKTYISNWKELGGNNLFFNPTGVLHPVLFVRKLNEIIEEAEVPEHRRVHLAINCLRGSALDWASLKEKHFRNFGHFKELFTERYWGVDEERETYERIKYGRYEGGSKAEYFLKMAREATYLSEALSDDKLVELIGAHFPPETRRGILSSGAKTVEDVEIFLRKDDRIEDDRLGRRNSRANGDARRGWNRNQIPTNNNRNSENTNRGRVSHEQKEGGNELLTLFNQSYEDLISEKEEESGEEEAKQPIVDIKVGKTPINALVDSGSQFTCISEELYKQLNQKETKIPSFPVVGVQLRGALGSQSQRVSQQVLIELSIQGYKTEVVCLVVPKLRRPFIIGYDWLKEYKAVLKIEEKQLIVRIGDTVVNCPVGNVKREESVEVNEIRALVEVGGEQVKMKYYDEKDRKNVAYKAELLKEEHKIHLCALLENYAQLFSNQPGLIKGYEHEILMKDETPFLLKSIPIPHAYRSEVGRQMKEMIDWGVIRQADTEYISPLVVVIKKDKSVRVCLDARHLNQVMTKEHSVPLNPEELARNRLISRAKKRRKRHDRGSKLTVFQPGDKVWVKSHKLSSAENREIAKFFLLYDGPCVVHKVVGPNSYELVDENGKFYGKHNVWNLKPYVNSL